MGREAFFAEETLKAYSLYAYLSEHERNQQARQFFVLLGSAMHEQFDFWARKSGVRGDMARVSMWELLYYRTVRYICGVSYVAHAIVRRKEKRVEEYVRYCVTCGDPKEQKTIEAFVTRIETIVRSYKTQ